ncbi:hypothetical protein [Brevundimonas lenta]|uniref:Lipoprotein n=1 Tax=Brevundimonas lenta TaxID=424796 RepID=A0A7W6JGQ4_9CAUL|nr:hypothetical protein [Brevundimonas lenta]MBB4083787.1 hypothetical protein [Brevundimonas lenta]
MRTSILLAFGAGVLALGACQQSTKAPFNQGVCYAVELGPDGAAPKFNVVAENQPQIEFCAARLEEMRQRFLRMGGTRREIIGAYQGRFIFIDRAGVSFGQTLEGSRFMALARTGDGRLAIPGAIQQEVDGGPATAPTAPAPPAN